MLAGQQSGLVSAEQLRELGLSCDEIRGWMRRGLLHRIYRGVYAVGHRSLSSQARMRAALMSCGPSAFLSHRTAAAVWGLRAVNPWRIELTVCGTKALKRSGLVIHRTADRLGKGEVTTRNGLRVSSVARLLVELAPTETLKELERLITQAIRKRILNLATLEEMLERYARRPGITKLRQALRDYRPRPERKSSLEAAFDRLIAEAGIPEPQRNVYIDGYELDCYWPEHRLIVELDGRSYHEARVDMERDRVKDNHFLLKRISTLRYTDRQFEFAPGQIAQQVRRMTT